NGNIKYDFLLDVDSALSLVSPFRTELDNELIDHIRKDGVLADPVNNQVGQLQVELLERHLSVTVAKRKGVQVVHTIKDGQQYATFYFGKWFLGYYELAPKKPLLEKLTKQRKLFHSNPIAFVKTDLDNF